MKKFFTKKRKMNIGMTFLLLILIAALFLINIRYNQSHYSVEFYKVSSSKISNNVRLVYLSDLHLREYGQDNADLLTDIESLKPDIILLGGDMVIDETANYRNMVQFCSELVKIAPSYGIWGNHEDVKMYIQNDTKLMKEFMDTGVRFLTNEAETLTVKESKIHICGVDGNTISFDNSGAKAVMEKFDTMTDGYRICLAHVPTFFTQKLEAYGFDLGLAGHTHGGIVNIPKLGPIYSQEEGFLPKYANGQHTLSNDAELIISRGLGDSGRAIRVNNVPELTIIDLD